MQNPDSAHLIEEILRQQMNSLVLEAHGIAIERGSNCIGLQEILFLMRRDKTKLIRLMRHLSFKDNLTSLTNPGSGVSSLLPTPGASHAVPSAGFLDLSSLASPSNSSVSSANFSSQESLMEESTPGIKGINIHDHSSFNETTSHQALSSSDHQPMSKRQKICIDFLKTFDEFGHLTHDAFSDDYIDVEIRERMVRRDRMTQSMGDQEYLKFCDCRKASFSRNPQKFRQWLLQDFVEGDETNPQEPRGVLKLDNLALEAFQFLSFETVAQLVDLCFLVRQEQQKDPGDPVKGLITRRKLPLRGLHSCPQISDSFHETGSLQQQMHHPLSVGISLPVFKKKRKSDVWMESSSSLDLPSPDQDSIEPKHVREVARRITSPSGIFSLGSRTNRQSFLVKKPLVL